MDTLNVLYTVDVNYFRQFLVSLISLLETNKDKQAIKVFVIEEGFKDDNLRRINSLQKGYGNVQIESFAAEEIYLKLKGYNLNSYRDSYTPTLRLFYSFLIDEIDYLLYLDADTIVVDSINLRFLDDTKCCKASLDHMASSYKDCLPISLEHYYNSGVMFINHENFKKNECLERILFLIKNNKQVLQFPDQDIMNMALKGMIEVLPLNYNLFSTDAYFGYLGMAFYKRFGIDDFYLREEVRKARRSPVILHATDLYGIRPWHQNTIHPYNKIYEYYLKEIFGEVVKDEFNQGQNRLSFRLEKTMGILLNLKR